MVLRCFRAVQHSDPSLQVLSYSAVWAAACGAAARLAQLAREADGRHVGMMLAGRAIFLIKSQNRAEVAGGAVRSFVLAVFLFCDWCLQLILIILVV